ncbi:hypothetical protein [uncultured Treponema sp.]|uniref:hypothetical protein n=1 Tax=uncultured Treponema sp. TaxID=162155 RepID=UPI0025D1E0A2|nr:hypothetical protein [uncultured Treponema sp.]
MCRFEPASEVSAPTGEKPPWMAASANAGGAVGSKKELATRSPGSEPSAASHRSSPENPVQNEQDFLFLKL